MTLHQYEEPGFVGHVEHDDDVREINGGAVFLVNEEVLVHAQGTSLPLGVLPLSSGTFSLPPGAWTGYDVRMKQECDHSEYTVTDKVARCQRCDTSWFEGTPIPEPLKLRVRCPSHLVLLEPECWVCEHYKGKK